MDKVKKVIRAQLIASTALRALVGTRVYPSFSDVGDNPTYPLITLAHTGGLSEPNGIGYSLALKVDVWCHGTNDDLWAIYNVVREILNGKQFYVAGDNEQILCSCRETYVNDDLYEESTSLHHLASRYRISKLRGGNRI
jgi:hypothetical protein